MRTHLVIFAARRHKRAITQKKERSRDLDPLMEWGGQNHFSLKKAPAGMQAETNLVFNKMLCFLKIGA